MRHLTVAEEKDRRDAVVRDTISELRDRLAAVTAERDRLVGELTERCACCAVVVERDLMGAEIAAFRASLREEVAPLLEDMLSFIRTPDLDKLYPEWFKRTAAAARSWATRLRETAQTHVAVVGIDPKVLREAAEYLNGEGPAAYLKWRQRDAHAATLRSYAEWLEGLR